MPAETGPGTVPRSMALLSAAHLLSSEKRYSSASLLIKEAFPCTADLRTMVDRAIARRRWFFADHVLEQMALQDRSLLEDVWWRDARQCCDPRQALTVPALRFLLDQAKLQAIGNAPRSGPLVYLMHMSLPQNTTGYAMRSQNFLKALKDAGENVYPVTRPGFPADVGLDADEAIPCIDGIVYHRINAPSRSEAPRRAYPVRAAAALVAHLKDVQPWAIFAASNHMNAVPGLLAARQLGVPFFYDVRGFWELSRLTYDPDYAATPQFQEDIALEQFVAGQADAVFTLNTGMQAELVARGVSAARITVIPNAAERIEEGAEAELCPVRGRYATEWGLPDGVPVIGYIGSFSHYEGLDDLLRAAAILKRRGVDFRLLLIGEELPHLKGQVIPQLKALALSENIEELVIMPGAVPRDAVAACYGLIDIAPIPRRNTRVTALVSPLKPLEAMAMGKAVLVSDLPPLAELVLPGETGMVFAVGQMQDFADRLEELLRDRALRVRLGTAAQEWVQRERTWAMIGSTARGKLERLRLGGSG